MQGLYLVREKQKHRWEHFEHRADIGIRGFGATKEQAFEQAAVALTAVITEPEKVDPQQEVKITLRICEDETLLVDWLNRLVYEMSTRKMLFGRFEVRIDKQHLNAAAWGEKTNVKKHQPTVEVKAATYTALSVQQQQDGTWVAQCVVDV